MDRRNRTVVVLVVAVVMASVASYGVYRTVQAMPVQQVEVANYKVVVAAKPLGMGARVTADDVRLVAWPSGSPVAGGHTEIEAIVGRGVLSAFVENEPLTESKLAPIEAGAGISPTIPAGMRAMSVKVNEVVGVAGFVVPGTRVDVLVTLGTPGRTDESMTRTVASNVQVLTAGTRYDQEKAKDGEAIPSTVVTLMVSPVDAERIALAQSKGQIMLSLRNPLDIEEAVTQGVRTANLFGDAPRQTPATRASAPRASSAAPVTPQPTKPYMVETIKAAKRTTEEVKK
jgi:pilus assembly protein CpaB